MPHDRQLTIELKKLELKKLMDKQDEHGNEYLYLQRKIIKLESEIRQLEENKK